MKKVAIMQPYFLPYIGYFQLLAAVDEFVVYDNIQFSKKGWIHRNRMLTNGNDEYFSISLKKDSDFLNINQRFLSENWSLDKDKSLRKIKENYRKAPQFGRVFPLIENIFNYNESNLFQFIFHSLISVANYLDIKTPIVVSSQIEADHDLKSQDKVLDICLKSRAGHYINPIGGWDLYQSEAFDKNGVELSFLKSRPFEYQQFDKPFVPWLSILDVLMFNETAKVQTQLLEFDLLKNA